MHTGYHVVRLAPRKRAKLHLVRRELRRSCLTWCGRWTREPAEVVQKGRICSKCVKAWEDSLPRLRV